MKNHYHIQIAMPWTKVSSCKDISMETRTGHPLLKSYLLGYLPVLLLALLQEPVDHLWDGFCG